MLKRSKIIREIYNKKNGYDWSFFYDCYMGFPQLMLSVDGRVVSGGHFEW